MVGGMPSISSITRESASRAGEVQDWPSMGLAIGKAPTMCFDRPGFRRSVMQRVLFNTTSRSVELSFYGDGYLGHLGLIGSNLVVGTNMNFTN